MIDLKELAPWIVGLSILMFVVSLIVLPLVVIWMPTDYLVHKTPRFSRLRGTHPILRWSVLVLKNLVGGLLVAAGLIMLFTPGQGLLAIVAGVMMLDIPGKRAVERRFLHRPSVLRLINSIRAKAGRPPLENHDDTSDT